MKRARDSQRDRVYRWERKAVALYAATLNRPYTRDEGQAMVDRVWRECAARVGQSVRNVPSLRFRNAKFGWSFYKPGKHEIAIAHSELWVLLHELAHALNYNEHAGHGRRFVAIYVMLLVRYGGAIGSQLRESAHAEGVDVQDAFHEVAPLSETIRNFLPGTAIDVAIAAGVNYRQVHGALIGLIKRGEVTRRGKVYRAKVD